MTRTPGRAPVALSRLRDIGWRLWDPIGIGPPEPGYAEEYDGYLLDAFGLLRRGAPQSTIVECLIAIEEGHMGLGRQQDARSRAQATVKAIYAYVVELDGSPPDPE